MNLTTTGTTRTHSDRPNFARGPRTSTPRSRERFSIRSVGSSRFRCYEDSEEEAIETCRNLLSRCPTARLRVHAPDGTSFLVTLDPDDDTIQIDSVSEGT